jgi:hypothetical protein
MQALTPDVVSLFNGAAEPLGSIAQPGIGDNIQNLISKANSLSNRFQGSSTGTGSSQSIPHGLGVIPSIVHASVYNNDALSSFSIVEGAHTSTNLVVTVTSGVGFKIIAFA